MNVIDNSKNSDVGILITQNAIDFLERSINEFDSDPKYSIIHFVTSIELFLKARLALEHWTLVAEKIDDGSFDYGNLMAGDAKTVSADNVRKRIKKILHTHSDNNTETKVFEAFGKLTNYRNKIIHFAMPSNAQMEIAELQCRSWHYLHSLLENQWLSAFEVIQPDFQYRLNVLNQLMQKQRQYLAVKYEELKPKIEQRKNEGWTYSDCPSCGYDAFRHSFTSESLSVTVGRCEVCGDGDPVLRCTSCKAKMNLEAYESGRIQCQKCSKTFSDEDIAQILGNTYGCFFDYKHGDDGTNVVWCNDCETETVACISGTWFCTNCEHEFDDSEIVACEYCNTPIAGGAEDTYYDGCLMCEGKHGDIMAEDN